MISINATLILQIIHILILVFILNRILFRPIQGIIQRREDHLLNEKEDIHRLEEEAERLKNQFREQQTSARKDAALERGKLKEAGSGEAEEYIDASRKEAASIRAKADDDAETELKRTKPLLSEQSTLLADDIIERLIDRRAEA